MVVKDDGETLTAVDIRDHWRRHPPKVYVQDGGGVQLMNTGYNRGVYPFQGDASNRKARSR